MGEKILKFPGQDGPRVHLNSRQRSLFSAPLEHKGRFCFLNLEKFNQNSFLNLIARNRISMVVDARKLPIFRRPAFSHTEIVEYFRFHNVIYFEYAVAQSTRRLSLSYDFAFPSDDRARDGLAICIYDASAMGGELISEIRLKFAQSEIYPIEINPRSLL